MITTGVIYSTYWYLVLSNQLYRCIVVSHLLRLLAAECVTGCADELLFNEQYDDSSSTRCEWYT